MQTITTIYIILAVVLSFSIAFFQYFFKENKRPKVYLLLFFLKFTAIFLLALLLINPVIKKNEIKNIKPVLSVVVDNSKSISFFNEQKSVNSFLQSIRNDLELNKKFSVQEFTFDSSFSVLDSLTFSGLNSNLANAISSANNLNKGNIAPIILLTDGNQTVGNDYEFVNSSQKIFPVIFGDTLLYKDLKISHINFNKYSFIGNKFPIETFLNYEGKESVSTILSIFKNGKRILKKRIKFSKNENSKIITTYLTSKREGLQYYTARIGTLNGEKNIKNNSKGFSVEVINEQTKILLITSVLHPDLGTFKKSIESNKQRKVEIVLIDSFNKKLRDYQLVILYQPNQKFSLILDKIKNNHNFLLVSGTNTNWNFINSKKLGFYKNVLNKTEDYRASYYDSYPVFYQKDIDFNLFHPLKDFFGNISFTKEHKTLLHQNINGVKIKQPLLATFDENNRKTGVLFGEGIWKWRAKSFVNTNSFEDFDEFIGNLIQYLASNKKRSRLEIDMEAIYPANSTILISAFYTDKNYKFDHRAKLEIEITEATTKRTIKVPFVLGRNNFQTEIEDLPPGNYKYKVSAVNKKIHKSGKFKITDFQVEEQFTNANFKKLFKLASNTQGEFFYKDDFNKLKNKLLENSSFYNTQKLIVSEQNLINWKWLMFFIVILLSAEWFIRKYIGKI